MGNSQASKLASAVSSNTKPMRQIRYRGGEGRLRGLVVSTLLHASLALLMIIGIPSVKRDMVTDYAVVTDIVAVSELTNVRVKDSNRKDSVQQQTKKAPKSAEVAQAQDKPKAEESKKEPAPVEAEKIPDKKLKKEEKPKEEKPKEPEKKKEEQAKKQDDDFSRTILKSIEEEKKKKQDKKIDKNFKELADALKGDTNKDYNENLPMSVSEIDAIKGQISRNWNTSAFSGSADAKTMQVVLEIKLDMDGKVISVKPKLENHKSPYYRPFVESAVRAVKASSPLQNLQKEKYHTWKEIEFRFDASGMIY